MKWLVAEVAHQPRLLLGIERHALVVVVREAREREERLLRDRQQPLLLARHRHAVDRVQVHHAVRILARLVHRAVDGEARRVDRRRASPSPCCRARSIFTRLEAVISSNIIPYGLMRKWCSGPGTRAERWVKTRSSQPYMATSAVGGGEVGAHRPLLGGDLRLRRIGSMTQGSACSWSQVSESGRPS